MGAEATAASSKGVFGAHSVCVGVFSGLPYWFSAVPLVCLGCLHVRCLFQKKLLSSIFLFLIFDLLL